MPDGSLDGSFDAGAGANGSVYSMAVQSDGKILVGGSFSTFNNLNRSGIVRLNPDGSVDTGINFGTGANGSVLDIAVLPNYKILIGGGFTLFDGLEREYFTQLHGGIIEGEGTLEFAEPFYSVGETGTNATIRVVRRGGLSGAVQVRINTLLSAGDTPAVPGLDFESIDQLLAFPEGEVLQKVQIDIIDDPDVRAQRDRRSAVERFHRRDAGAAVPAPCSRSSATTVSCRSPRRPTALARMPRAVSPGYR